MTKSEQARADAMADAETLRLYVLRNADLAHADRQASALRTIQAELAQKGLTAKNAQRIARAAFRAVPGLRG